MVNENNLSRITRMNQDGTCKSDERSEFAWNMRELLARKWSSLIWGQSYVFQSDNDKISTEFGKWERLNKFKEILMFVERYASKYGRCVITLNKTKSGDITLNIPNPFYFSGIGKVVVQPQLAVIWQNYVIDQRMFVIKTTYDTKKVVNDVFFKDQNENVRIYDKQAEILEQLQIEKEWYHNLGFVPVVEVQNIPLVQFYFNNWEFITLADWYPAYLWEGLAFDTYTNLRKELFFCHARVIVDNANQKTLNQIQELGYENKIKLNDYIIETESGSDFKVQQGNGDFTKYTSTLDHIYDFYFKCSGMSRFSEGGGAQKTVAETSSIRAQMIESVNQKINLRTEQITDLIRKVLAAKGLMDYWEGKDEFIFKINGNIIKDETSYIDNKLKLIDAGIITPVDLIQDLFGVSRQEAEEKYDENQEYLKQRMEQMGLTKESESDEDGEFNKETGEHKAPDKQGVA